jgi:acetyl-CoA synthetase
MNPILNKLCPRTEFDSYEDFYENYRCIVPDNFNFAYDVADEWARVEPGKLALLWTNDDALVKSYTFGDMKRLSDKAANALFSLGIKKGDVVMIVLKQRPEVWMMMLALEKIGAVCIPGTYQLTKKDIEYRCEKAEVKLLVAVDDAELVANIKASNITDKNQTRVILLPEMHALIEQASDKWERPQGDANTQTAEPMLIYFSSGTTGMPKMVRHNHTLPLGHIVTAKFWQCVEENQVHLTQSDSGWAKFAWGKIYGQWICGAAVGAYDTEKFTPDGMLAALERLHPRTFCAPATIFRYLIKEDLSHFDFSFIKHTSVAGEPLSPEVYHQIKAKTGLEIREGFGQSEGSVLAAAFKWVDVRPGSMGKPSPLYGLDLLDEDLAPVDDGIVGNISVTRAGQNMYETDKMGGVPGLFRGYWKDQAVTEKCWHDGVYQTGDMAWRDADGYYWFIGRNDDVIKCSGYRIGPFEVESALMEHPSVLECAVTAAPDPMRGQVVKATIVLSRDYRGENIDRQALKKELQNHVKHATAPYKYPRIIEFVDELPKTISGKIQRNIIRQKDAE